jgi:hypothetical protein
MGVTEMKKLGHICKRRYEALRRWNKTPCGVLETRFWADGWTKAKQKELEKVDIEYKQLLGGETCYH